MAVELPLVQMPLDDKLQSKELLWANLSKDHSLVVSPAWHGDLLRNRREQVQQGKASFQSWDAAIGELKAELHEQPIG
jgi:hypothetical protein